MYIWLTKPSPEWLCGRFLGWPVHFVLLSWIVCNHGYQACYQSLLKVISYHQHFQPQWTLAGLGVQGLNSLQKFCALAGIVGRVWGGQWPRWASALLLHCLILRWNSGQCPVILTLSHCTWILCYVTASLPWAVTISKGEPILLVCVAQVSCAVPEKCLLNEWVSKGKEKTLIFPVKQCFGAKCRGWGKRWGRPSYIDTQP